jgi:hypothetical protein
MPRSKSNSPYKLRHQVRAYNGVVATGITAVGGRRGRAKMQQVYCEGLRMTAVPDHPR